MKPHPVLAKILRALYRAAYGAVSPGEETAVRLTGKLRAPRAVRPRPRL
jgi:hypothetical protein